MIRAKLAVRRDFAEGVHITVGTSRKTGRKYVLKTFCSKLDLVSIHYKYRSSIFI